MAALKTLHDLYVQQLKDAGSAESQLIKVLPKMAQAAQSAELRHALEDHLVETEEHLRIVEDLLADVDSSRGRTKCDAMAGLVEEGEGILDKTAAPAVMDAGIIAACQKAEHSEIATYGTLKAWAELLGYTDAVTSLDTILIEERAADEKLSELASSINVDADAS